MTDNIELVAQVLVAHGLEHAGRRWLKGLPRSVHRERHGLPISRLHEQYPVPSGRVATVLDGVWSGVWSQAAPGWLLDTVAGYLQGLLAAGAPHDVDRLRVVLRDAGCVDDAA